LQPTLQIHDDDAFDHPGENGFHPASVARQLTEATPELVDRFVERARHSAKLIVAEIELRRREVATAIPARDRSDPADAAPDPSRDQPRNASRPDEGQAKREKR